MWTNLNRSMGMTPLVLSFKIPYSLLLLHMPITMRLVRVHSRYTEFHHHINVVDQMQNTSPGIVKIRSTYIWTAPSTSHSLLVLQITCQWEEVLCRPKSEEGPGSCHADQESSTDAGKTELNHEKMRIQILPVPYSGVTTLIVF